MTGVLRRKKKFGLRVFKAKLCEVTRVSVLIFYYVPYLHLKVMFSKFLFFENFIIEIIVIKLCDGRT